jgi:hypothetical protein
MSVVGALTAARAAGVHLGIDGDDLVLEAASAPPAPVLESLSRHKAEIMVLLRPAEDGWTAEDWQVRTRKSVLTPSWPHKRSKSAISLTTGEPNKVRRSRAVWLRGSFASAPTTPSMSFSVRGT